MKEFFGKVWSGTKAAVKKLTPKGEQWLDLLGFVLLVIFYAAIPFILFCQTFGNGGNGFWSKFSLGMFIGVILIAIVVKKMWLNNQASAIRTRVGVMTDNLKTETDPIKKEKLAYRIALKNILLVIINLIVPILCIVAIVAVCSFLENLGETVKAIKWCVWASSISFLMGVITQITFPFIKARLCYKHDKDKL